MSRMIPGDNDALYRVKTVVTYPNGTTYIRYLGPYVRRSAAAGQATSEAASYAYRSSYAGQNPPTLTTEIQVGRISWEPESASPDE